MDAQAAREKLVGVTRGGVGVRETWLKIREQRPGYRLSSRVNLAKCNARASRSGLHWAWAGRRLGVRSLGGEQAAGRGAVQERLWYCYRYDIEAALCE